MLLLACVQQSPIRDLPAGTASDTAVEAIEGDDGKDGDDKDDDKEDDDEEEKDDDHGCSSIFDQDELPVYHLEIADQVWAEIQSEYAARDGTKDYHDVESFRLDDETMEHVSIRLKGNEGYSWVGEKMQFVISFVEYDDTLRFHGERHVAFDAPWYDYTYLHNRLATRVLRDLDIPAPCANNALLYINGDLYGLYAHMEQLDHEYLERNFGDDAADGNLYKYGWELANNEGADTSRMSQWWASYDPAVFFELGEPEQWVGEWAAEALLPDCDGYWYSGHNYYLYDHPEQGFLYLPWDLDYTFEMMDPSLDIYSPYSAYTPHLAATLAIASYDDLYVQKLSEYLAVYVPDELVADIQAWRAQIDQAAQDDPYKTFTYSDTSASWDALEQFPEPRARYIERVVESRGY